jgi:hypothetical protein
MYHDAEPLTYPVHNTWRTGLHPFDNIAAELDAALQLFQRVEYDEGARMCGESLSRQAQGIAIIWHLADALKS